MELPIQKEWSAWSKKAIGGPMYPAEKARIGSESNWCTWRMICQDEWRWEGEEWTNEWRWEEGMNKKYAIPNQTTMTCSLNNWHKNQILLLRDGNGVCVRKEWARASLLMQCCVSNEGGYYKAAHAWRTSAPCRFCRYEQKNWELSYDPLCGTTRWLHGGSFWLSSVEGSLAKGSLCALLSAINNILFLDMSASSDHCSDPPASSWLHARLHQSLDAGLINGFLQDRASCYRGSWHSTAVPSQGTAFRPRAQRALEISVRCRHIVCSRSYPCFHALWDYFGSK